MEKKRKITLLRHIGNVGTWLERLRNAVYLLQLSDLIIEIVDATLILQAELREQVSAELGLQGLPRALHGV